MIKVFIGEAVDVERGGGGCGEGIAVKDACNGIVVDGG